MLGLILAGGHGTRLSLLNGHGSKALVPVGQRPHLIHQVELLRDAGCHRIVVVTSFETDRDVDSVIRRSGLRGVTTTMQNSGRRGPVGALHSGLMHANTSDGVHVLMADTYLSEPLQVADKLAVTVGVANAPASRSWAYSGGKVWVDDFAPRGTEVTIGAYYIPEPVSAIAASNTSPTHSEIPMSYWLNKMQTVTAKYDTWQDLGDIEALQRARTSLFMARDHNGIEMLHPGVLEKTGKVAGEYEWLHTHRDTGMVPRVWESEHTDGYCVEQIDMPNLSELWLYREGRPDTWAYILKSVMAQLQDHLWANYPDQLSSEEWFQGKAIERLPQAEFDTTAALNLLHSLPSPLPKKLDAIVGHGDLNFNNIFYSLSTGAIKLIDPRGDWGIPDLYELAKLRYSYHGGFSAITHNLHTHGRIMPYRDPEIKAMDEVLFTYGYTEKQLTYAEACIMLAGVPLHSGKEARGLYNRGLELLCSF